MSFKRTIGIVGLAAILLAIPLTLTLNQRAQTLQQQAAEPSPTVSQAQLDVTQDGVVDSFDVNEVLRCINEPSTCEVQNMQDLDGDGVVTVEDYRILFNGYSTVTP